MPDPFQSHGPGLDSPAANFASVTPADGADLAIKPRFLIVGVGGDLRCIGDNGAAVTIPVPAGVVPIRPTRILATGTTASGIVACW